MITSLTLLKKKGEYEPLLRTLRRFAAVYTDEMWSYPFFQSISETERFLETEPVVDLVNWDVTIDGALALLEKMRSQCQKACLMIIADMSISPMQYLKPGILPEALLLKPINSDDMENVVRALFEVFIRRMDAQEDAFLVETREGKQYIPMEQIDYFEAKEKKVFVRVKSFEYGFYDTLDTLEKRLPSGFIRCHRSYIVNMKRARGMISADSIIRMADGARVPFSRSYKHILKEYFKNV